jgi:predicted CoA-binding protein
MARYRIADWQALPVESRSAGQRRQGKPQSRGTAVNGSEANDRELSELLSHTRNIAVVGIKDRKAEDAYSVPLYLQSHGYRILPVNPGVTNVLGEPCVARLADLAEPVDIVDLFRAIDHIPHHAQEILEMTPPPRAVWMQLGILHGGATASLRAAGIQVVQDRCIMVEHRRLFAG